MSKFRNNIINIYQEKGQDWLNQLPDLLRILPDKWDLSDLKSVENLSFNYILKGFQGKSPIVLTIGLDNNSLYQEAKTLRAWSGLGAIKIYEFDNYLGVLLLEQAVPGNSLLNYADTNNTLAPIMVGTFPNQYFH
ncbi:hypothetical protein [Rickettsiales endosymbiont of Stachyamoeba lipophora]|uniref:hypothetical protein n=1 Tax=Rickettsiales endosymbiont of Stachyamoeba lipophora TaxID=2486578 RepID=UPI000F651C87|nr:hypothetical protein [Rickettsiales endosymbiont of Stachyamoeba lipophora]AZL16352.1 hypothetical protein EF513_07425 [Rickettsiales endosymbiont of Stachyamoeba lipophora]